MENKELETMFNGLNSLLEDAKMKELKLRLDEMNEMDVAAFITELPKAKMAMVFRLLHKEQAAEVFANLEVEQQEHIINSITDKELSIIIEELYLDDAVDMMEELPSNVVKRVMKNATSETRDLINQFLKYPENSAGSIMTAEFIDLKKHMNVQQCFDRIRRIGEDKETIYTCFVTSGDRQLEGVVTVKDLLLSPYEAIVGDIMDENILAATTHDDQEDVSELFSKYDLLAIPVVDSENRLVGIVTVDDVIDVIEQEATEDIEKMAALAPSEKPYLKTSVLRLSRNRITWLMLLMFSSMITGTILLSYEQAFAVAPLLVALMPMLTDTGGNAGSQSSTLIIRGMAVGEIHSSDILRVLWKELRVSLLVGTLLGGVNYARVLIMYPGESQIALVIAVSLLFTVVIAKTIGCVLPIIAKVCRLDPAIMAAPLITTIVDVVALVVYFQFAVWVMGL